MNHNISPEFVLVGILNIIYKYITTEQTVVSIPITMCKYLKKNQSSFYLRISLRGRPQMLG